MKRKFFFILGGVVLCTFLISARGIISTQDEPKPSPSAESYISYINIDLDEADHYDYAHVHYRGTTTDCGSTDGWYDLGNFYFDDYGLISINLGAPYGFIEAIVTVYIDGYPDCPYTVQDQVGYSCNTSLRHLVIDFNPFYPWACPEE